MQFDKGIYLKVVAAGLQKVDLAFLIVLLLQNLGILLQCGLSEETADIVRQHVLVEWHQKDSAVYSVDC